MSVEEQRLLARLARAKNASVHVPAHVGKGDGLLVSEDRTPNFRGALVTGLTDRAPVADLKALAADIDAGKVKSVLIVREDAAMLGLEASKLAKVRSVVLATHHNVTTAAAEVVLPALTVFERSGSFINCQFRLQAFAQAIPGPAGTLPDTLLLARLAGADAKAVWSELAANIPQLAGLDGAKLPAEGVALDGAAFAALRFPEGKLLKFAPVATA
jgi:NADH-quinone oxidoreductase subunit G